MKKVLHIIGTRPQIVKLASVINFKKINFQNLVIDTNQHYQKNMQEDLYDDFKISKEKITFLQNNKNFSNDVDAIKELLNKKVSEMNPDLIITYGDTNSTVAGALTAKENNISSIHVESGLRSYIHNQIEEKNRIFVDSISDYLFCPTLSSVKNLEKENLYSKSIFTGDIMLDIFLKTKNYLDQIIVDKTFPEEFYLFTLHRKENLEDKKKLHSIIESLYDFSNLIIPMHHSLKNKLVEYDLLESLPKNIELVDPLVYSDLLLTIKNSKGVITDSGGLQKEAYWFNKPTLTLRENTEWIETVDSGLNVIVNEFPVNLHNIISTINKTKEDRFTTFGNGNAVNNMISKIEEILL